MACYDARNLTTLQSVCVCSSHFVFHLETATAKQRSEQATLELYEKARLETIDDSVQIKYLTVA